ncbi:MAG: phosphotransferase [Pseudomonadota bacterium]
MPDRAVDRLAFLESAGWGNATVTPLAGDASQRAYFRVTRAHGSAILMDAPPATNTDTRAFLTIASHLRSLNLSAPNVLCEDVANGFVLLEDLGDDLFSTVLARAPRSETLLYRRAVDVLILLARQPVPTDIPVYGVEYMADLAALPYEWYAPGPEDLFKKAMARALTPVMESQMTIALRDFHVDNLIWLPEREGLASVGLLDFQDAAICHPAYDLVSLLRDVRRDVPAEIQKTEFTRFQVIMGLEPTAFSYACAVLSAQRGLRILGVFSRLATRDGKKRYLDYLPRVWSTLMDDLRHPGLESLNVIVRNTLPAPDAARMNALR